MPDLIARLVDHALLAREPCDPPRFYLLESVRDLTQQLGDAGAAEQRHAAFFGEHVAPLFVDLRGPGAAQAVERLVVEHANLRAAHRYAVGTQSGRLAIPLALCLAELARRRGPDQDALQVLEQTLPLAEEGTSAWVDLRWRYAEAHRMTHQHSRARELHDATLAKVHRDADRAKVLTAMLSLLTELGDGEAFTQVAGEARAAAEAAGDRRRQVIVLHNVAVWEWWHGSIDRATALDQEAGRAVEALGDPLLLAARAAHMVSLAISAGDAQRALNHAKQGIDVARAHDLPKYEVMLVMFAGRCELQLGEPRAALAYFDEAEDLAVRRDDRAVLQHIRLFRAEGLIDAGDYGDAEAALDSLRDLADKAAPSVGVWPALQGLLAQARGDGAGATRWFEQAWELARASEAAPPRTRALAAAHLAVGWARQQRYSDAESVLDQVSLRLENRGAPALAAMLQWARAKVLDARVAALREEAAQLERQREALVSLLERPTLNDVKRLLQS